MHLGRSHHIALSVVSGFTASFLVMIAASTGQYGGMQGQLVAGDPNLNRELPTTLNAMKGVVSGTDPLLTSMGSYGFWLTVILGGIVASFVALKMLRRYV
jgi:hypothetical protein